MSSPSVQSPTSATALIRQHEAFIEQSKQVRVNTKVITTNAKIVELKKKFSEEAKKTNIPIPHTHGTSKIIKAYVDKINEINNNSDEEPLKIEKRTAIKADYTGKLVNKGFAHEAATLFLTLAEKTCISVIQDTDENKDTARLGRSDNTSEYLGFAGAVVGTNATMSLGSPRATSLSSVPETAAPGDTGSPNVLMSMRIKHTSRTPESSTRALHGSPKSHLPELSPKGSPRAPSPTSSEVGTVVGQDDDPPSDTETVAEDGNDKKTATHDRYAKNAQNGTDTQSNGIDAATAAMQKLSITDSATQTTTQRNSTTEKIRRISTRDKFIYGVAAAGIGIVAIAMLAPRHCSLLDGIYCTS